VPGGIFPAVFVIGFRPTVWANAEAGGAVFFATMETSHQQPQPLTGFEDTMLEVDKNFFFGLWYLRNLRQLERKTFEDPIIVVARELIFFFVIFILSLLDRSF
jgi:hypothetical protein